MCRPFLVSETMIIIGILEAVKNIICDHDDETTRKQETRQTTSRG